MKVLLDQPPAALVEALRQSDSPRAWLRVEGSGAAARVEASSSLLEDLAERLPHSTPDLDGHAAVFLEARPDSGALFGAFIHRVRRGQAQGGLRRRAYETVTDFLHDGLRLSWGMSRKSALAGLWWGGGKGLIACPEADGVLESDARRKLYTDYGRFVSSLGGCYVTAVDSGTTAADMTAVLAGTRFVTCVAPDLGGSGNPSRMTAIGVVRAIEAALDHLGLGPVAGKRFAMQGAGNVGAHMIQLLVERGAGAILVAEVDAERREALHDRYADAPVSFRDELPGEPSILAESCDVLVPNGLGGVLDDKTIPAIRARVVCGAANNQLADDRRHAEALARRGIVWVPDYLANRMGIVSCADEHAGRLEADPHIERHLDAAWPGGIYATTRRILELAETTSKTPLASANSLADAAAQEAHPILGDRAERLVRNLIKGRWHEGTTPDGTA